MREDGSDSFDCVWRVFSQIAIWTDCRLNAKSDSNRKLWSLTKQSGQLCVNSSRSNKTIELSLTYSSDLPETELGTRLQREVGRVHCGGTGV